MRRICLWLFALVMFGLVAMLPLSVSADTPDNQSEIVLAFDGDGVDPPESITPPLLIQSEDIGATIHGITNSSTPSAAINKDPGSESDAYNLLTTLLLGNPDYYWPSASKDGMPSASIKTVGGGSSLSPGYLITEICPYDRTSIGVG